MQDQNGENGVRLDVNNNLQLQMKKVRVSQQYFVRLLYIYWHSTFFLALSISFSNNKDGKTKRAVGHSKLEAAKAVYLVKAFVNQLTSLSFLEDLFQTWLQILLSLFQTWEVPSSNI